MKQIFSKENLKKFFNTFIWLMVLVFIVDIVSKWLVVKGFGDPISAEIFSEGEMVTIIPNFLFIGRTYNLGAAWSMGASTSGKIVLMCVSLVLSGALIAYYVTGFKKMRTVIKVALSLMIAGAVGNLIDRALYWEKIVGFTGVVDWISCHFGDYVFPMFNIADSSLVIGVVILIIDMIIGMVKESKEKRASGAYDYSPEELKQKSEENKDGNQDK